MKRVLCFGDSNTWGYNPDQPGTRYESNTRWTGILASELGNEYQVIEEGLNGRTAIWDDPFGEHKNGKDYLIPCLETHREFDLIILMLGTNDLKAYFKLSAASIAQGVGVLIDIILKSPVGIDGNPPKVLLIAPPPTGKLTELDGMFEAAFEKSKMFERYYKELSVATNCHFINAGEFVKSSDLDGIHWEPVEHKKFAEVLLKKIPGILSMI